jgi:hypothetical protein
MGSHVAKALGLPPTTNPRYLKGVTPIRQLRKSEAIWRKSLEMLMPTRQLLKKFTLRPEVISNPRKIAFKAQRLPIEASPIHNVSSAYCKIEIG